MNLSTGPSVLPPRPTQVSGRPNTQAESLPANSRKRKKKLKPCALGSATPVYRVNRHKIRTDESISPQKQDYRVLGSYNLKLNRAIIVPGSPATYQPRRAVTPFSIRPDRGLTIVDPNRHVFSNCPLEPVIRAIAITSPNHDFKSIDFIVDRHNLRFLLQFCSKKEADRDYRVDAECVGPNNTILLYSHTGPTAEEANGRTFGRNFEDTVTHKSKHYFGYGPTQPRNAKAEGEVLAHYRACSYNLGGINICMRFEVDARCDGPKQVVPSQKRDVRTSSYEPESVVAGNCTIHKAGFLVPPEEIMELKSRKLLGKRQQLRSSSYGYYDQVSSGSYLFIGMDIANKLIVVVFRHSLARGRKPSSRTFLSCEGN